MKRRYETPLNYTEADLQDDHDVIERRRASSSLLRSARRSNLFGSAPNSSLSSSSLGGLPLSSSDSDSDPFLFSSSLGSSPSSSISTDDSYVFTPPGYSFLRMKGDDEGTSLGYFISGADQQQYLVKPFVGENKAEVIREFLGLAALKEMIEILGSSIITPDFSLQRDDTSGQLGLFIKIIPNLVLNSKVSKFSPLATPARGKSKPVFGASYRDLPLMVVLSNLLGDDDCTPDNSGSIGAQGVRIDLARAFLWKFANASDFMKKIISCFGSYKEHQPIQSFSSDFRQMCSQLQILARPDSVARIKARLSSSIKVLREYVGEQDLAEVVFQNKTEVMQNANKENPLLPTFPIIKATTITYPTFAWLEESCFNMLGFNLTNVLPAFLYKLSQEVATCTTTQVNRGAVLQTASSSNLSRRVLLTSSSSPLRAVDTKPIITGIENLSPNCSPVKGSFSQRLLGVSEVVASGYYKA